MLLQAVSAAKQAWGERKLKELDAEDRLATACEKAPTSDPATSKLRAAFRVQINSPLSLCGCHPFKLHAKLEAACFQYCSLVSSVDGLPLYKLLSKLINAEAGGRLQGSDRQGERGRREAGWLACGWHRAACKYTLSFQRLWLPHNAAHRVHGPILGGTPPPIGLLGEAMPSAGCMVVKGGLLDMRLLLGGLPSLW